MRFGRASSLTPLSNDFGYSRGTPVDRHYIEAFLAEQAADIRGRVLEVGDDSYCRRFGTGVTQQDVLHLSAGHPGATIAGDLSQPGVLPDAAFDCMVLTQTLHLVYDLPAAAAALRQALRPGGVLLLTVPGIASADRGEWGEQWYWSLTRQSVTRLFGEVFGPENISVVVTGNVYAATCFLHGLALEEIEAGWLAEHDPAYPMVVCLRAVRADGHAPAG
jgi:SAM-dependent methyltransferase